MTPTGLIGGLETHSSDKSTNKATSKVHIVFMAFGVSLKRSTFVCDDSLSLVANFNYLKLCKNPRWHTLGSLCEILHDCSSCCYS